MSVNNYFCPLIQKHVFVWLSETAIQKVSGWGKSRLADYHSSPIFFFIFKAVSQSRNVQDKYNCLLSLYHQTGHRTKSKNFWLKQRMRRGRGQRSSSITFCLSALAMDVGEFEPDGGATSSVRLLWLTVWLTVLSAAHQQRHLAGRWYFIAKLLGERRGGSRLFLHLIRRTKTSVWFLHESHWRDDCADCFEPPDLI